MTFLNVWRAWHEADRSKRWCGTHFLNYRNLLRAADIRRQLEFALKCAATTLRLNTRLRPDRFAGTHYTVQDLSVSLQSHSPSGPGHPHRGILCVTSSVYRATSR